MPKAEERWSLVGAAAPRRLSTSLPLADLEKLLGDAYSLHLLHIVISFKFQ